MRLLLVEDDEPLARAIAHALRASNYAVDWLASGRDADTALLTQEFDLIILDLNLPGRDGFEVLARLRTRKNTTPVMILSARDETRDRIRGLDLGADDYLTKPFELDELEARVRALIRRARTGGQSAIEIGNVLLDTAARRITVGATPLELTAREYGLLELLILRAGHVVSKDTLAERLCEWGDEMSHGAIEIHVHRLRKKLAGATLELRTLRGFGYMLEPRKESADAAGPTEKGAPH